MQVTINVPDQVAAEARADYRPKSTSKSWLRAVRMRTAT